MIEESIQIHDSYQFEIKLGYALTEAHKATAYDIETYIFLPNSLGINRRTYQHDDFYNDIQAYIRLKTPIVLLKDLSQYPLKQLETSLHELVSEPNEATISQYEYHIKMYCCILKSALRDHVEFLAEKQNATDIEDLVVKYLESVEDITRRFRQLRSIINFPTIDERIFSRYLFGDEYVSMLIESYTYQLLEHIKKKKIVGKQAYREKLLNLVHAEVAYREANDYPSVPDQHSDNEGLIFRSSVLKKYMGSALFLSTRLKEEGGWLEQLIFAIAAGIAMVFATAAAFFSQYRFESLSLPLFLVLVISYMFKDRLKEGMRNYLWKKIHPNLFDHKLNIYSSPKDKVGWCKESFSFIRERDIPEKILGLRDRDHITEIENGWVGEKTILYRKRIKLFGKRLRRVYRDFSIESINDILRLNVFKFLSKMDNPTKELYIADKEHGYRKIHGQRVYHLNMITKYSMKGKVLYKRFRIVLNRDGIKRIEEVRMDEENHV